MIKIKGVHKEVVDVEISVENILDVLYETFGVKRNEEYRLSKHGYNKVYPEERLHSLVDVSRHGSPIYEISQTFSKEQTECFIALREFEKCYIKFKEV